MCSTEINKYIVAIDFIILSFDFFIIIIEVETKPADKFESHLYYS